MSAETVRLLQSLLAPGKTAWQQLHWSPPVDIYRLADGWIVKFDLAGVRPSDVQLTIHGPHLTIRGRRRDWVVEESRCSAYLMEITYSDFERTVEFPCDIGELHLHTDYRDGMLLVRLQAEGRPA
jgi:HSP20 family protein